MLWREIHFPANGMDALPSENGLNLTLWDLNIPTRNKAPPIVAGKTNPPHSNRISRRRPNRPKRRGDGRPAANAFLGPRRATCARESPEPSNVHPIQREQQKKGTKPRTEKTTGEKNRVKTSYFLVVKVDLGVLLRSHAEPTNEKPSIFKQQHTYGLTTSAVVSFPWSC